MNNSLEIGQSSKLNHAIKNRKTSQMFQRETETVSFCIVAQLSRACQLSRNIKPIVAAYLCYNKNLQKK